MGARKTRLNCRSITSKCLPINSPEKNLPKCLFALLIVNNIFGLSDPRVFICAIAVQYFAEESTDRVETGNDRRRNNWLCKYVWNVPKMFARSYFPSSAPPRSTHRNWPSDVTSIIAMLVRLELVSPLTFIRLHAMYWKATTRNYRDRNQSPTILPNPHDRPLYQQVPLTGNTSSGLVSTRFLIEDQFRTWIAIAIINYLMTDAPMTWPIVQFKPHSTEFPSIIHRIECN